MRAAEPRGRWVPVLSRSAAAAGSVVAGAALHRARLLADRPVIHHRRCGKVTRYRLAARPITYDLRQYSEAALSGGLLLMLVERHGIIVRRHTPDDVSHADAAMSHRFYLSRELQRDRRGWS